MVPVRQWKFAEVPRPLTKLFVSDSVIDEIANMDGSVKNRLNKVLKRCTQRGFWNSIGVEGCPIKLEWGMVYRIRYEMFRIIGFFEFDERSDFIAISAFNKAGQKLNDRERGIVNNVVNIKQSKTWAKSNG